MGEGKKKMNEAVITMRLSEGEINLLINSLQMLETAVVPCVDNGTWKVPYEVLKKDLTKIQGDIIVKRREHEIKQKLGKQ
jgi:hypothetical protein